MLLLWFAEAASHPLDEVFHTTRGPRDLQRAQVWEPGLPEGKFFQSLTQLHEFGKMTTFLSLDFCQENHLKSASHGEDQMRIRDHV